MHERQRHQRILEALAERSVVTVVELRDQLDASPATVRRDLARLAEAGQLRKVHGGAEAVSGRRHGRLATRSFRETEALNYDQKRRIAKAAVALCADGEAIIVNGGTTTYRMTEFLADRGLQILTNSFAMAAALVAETGNRVVLPGGEVYRAQNIVLSPYERDTVIDHFYARRMFTGAQAVRAQGLIEGDPLLIKTEQKMLRQAEELIVLVDSSKFEPRGSLILCPLERIDRLITDEGVPERVREMLERAGVEVIIAPALAEETAAVA